MPDSGTSAISSIVVVEAEALAKTDVAKKTLSPIKAAQTEDEFYDEDADDEEELLLSKSGE